MMSDKRLKVANDAISKISKCFTHVHGTSSPQILEQLFSESILSGFPEIASKFGKSLPEEISMRIIQKFSHIYLKYLLQYDLKGQLKGLPMNGVLKELINQFLAVKFEDAEHQKFYEEAIDQNLLNLMQVIKSESSVESLQIAIKAANLQQIKPSVIDQVLGA